MGACMSSQRPQHFRAVVLATLSAAITAAAGTAFLDVILAAARSQEPTPVGALLRSAAASVGLYGALALCLGAALGLVVASIGATFPAGAPGRLRARLADDEALDRGVAAAIFATGVAAAVLVA